MSAFAELDALVMDVELATFGELCTIYPMKPGPAGQNGSRVADPARDPLDDVPVIRSEWAERLQIGGQGMPTPPGGHRQGVAGRRHIATVKILDLAWTPRQGDELEYVDAPNVRYRLSEPMPDGLSGLHLGLSRI